MKKLALLLPLLGLILGLNSCSMTDRKAFTAGSYEETYQARVCGAYDIVREETVLDAKSGLVEVTETKVPRYETRTRTKYVRCKGCTRYYWLKDGCCGLDMDQAIDMATAQGPTGSPHVGLIPTMKTIVPD